MWSVGVVVVMSGILKHDEKEINRKRACTYTSRSRQG